MQVRLRPELLQRILTSSVKVLVYSCFPVHSIYGLLIAFITLTQIGIMGGSADLSLVKGALYLAACLPMGIVGWISGASQGKAAAASIGLVAKRPEQFGKAMIFPAMVETYAILALLISILSIFGIAGLNINQHTNRRLKERRTWHGGIR